MAGLFRESYDEWLVNLANNWLSNNRNVSYKKLLRFLNSVYFSWTIDMDENRAADGVDFRLRYADSHPDVTYRDVYLYLNHKCTVLEMMVALAARCEEQIVGNLERGLMPDRWFMRMLSSMHLIDMDDEHYDEFVINAIIRNFLDRNYKEDGEGSLFWLDYPCGDMRTVEIWRQMAWYLNETNY